MFAHSDADPEISIGYTVKDPELEKTKLLGDALRDAEAAVILGMLIFHHKTRKWKFRDEYGISGDIEKYAQR